MRGPVAEKATDPLKEISVDTKVDQLGKNNLPIGNVKSTLEVKKRYHTTGVQTGVEVHQAVVDTPPWQ